MFPSQSCSKLASYTAPKSVMEDVPMSEDGDQVGPGLDEGFLCMLHMGACLCVNAWERVAVCSKQHLRVWACGEALV